MLEFPSFLVLNNTLLFVHITLAHPFFGQWALGGFHVLIIVKNAAMTMGILSVLFGISSQVELLDHQVVRFLSACDGENVHILRNGEVI